MVYAVFHIRHPFSVDRFCFALHISQMRLLFIAFASFVSFASFLPLCASQQFAAIARFLCENALLHLAIDRYVYNEPHYIYYSSLASLSLHLSLSLLHFPCSFSCKRTELLSQSQIISICNRLRDICHDKRFLLQLRNFISCFSHPMRMDILLTTSARFCALLSLDVYVCAKTFQTNRKKKKRKEKMR